MSKRSTPSCCSPGTAGFSLVEMLIALAVTMAVTAGALSLALSSRRIYELDEARTRLNQSLRASRDFLVADVRQAGERLADTFPVLEMIRGEDLPGGAAGDPDQLVIRRNLVDTMLRVCLEDISGSDRRIYVSTYGITFDEGCVPVPDSDGDDFHDNHGVWNAYRLAAGVDISGEQAVPAYIYNPTNGEGEFFWYWGDYEGSFPDEPYIETPPGQNWTNTYPAADRPQLFILEERRYLLSGDLMQLIVNQDDANPLNLVDGIEDFQVRARFQIPPLPAPQVEPTPQESFGFGDDWTSLRAVEITVRGRVPFKDRTLSSEWSSEIMPRNVLSR